MLMRVLPRVGLLALGLFGLPLGLSLGGCASDVGPSAAELKARWEAQNVYPDNYKRDLLAFMHTYLNDPTRIRGAAASRPERKSVGEGERFVVCVRYTERKDDGTYGKPKDGAAPRIRVGKSRRCARTPYASRFRKWKRSRARGRGKISDARRPSGHATPAEHALGGYRFQTKRSKAASGDEVT
jgi:hypothetical protein